MHSSPVLELLMFYLNVERWLNDDGHYIYRDIVCECTSANLMCVVHMLRVQYACMLRAPRCVHSLILTSKYIHIHIYTGKRESKINRQKIQRIVGCNLIIIPLSMLPLVFAAVLGPTAYEVYYLGYATSKNCLQIEIITGKHYATTDR